MRVYFTEARQDEEFPAVQYDRERDAFLTPYEPGWVGRYQLDHNLAALGCIFSLDRHDFSTTTNFSVAYGLWYMYRRKP